MINVACVVVLYNPSEDNINNVLSYSTFMDKIYVVDNSNTNNEKMFFNIDNIKYIANMENKGIANALNIGALNAIKEKFHWLITMDQDSNLSKKNYDSLLKYISENDTKNIGIVSPYHNVETNNKKSDETVEECLEVMTSGNFVNLEIYKKIGGFKDWLFIDLVDIEYCFNLNKNGYKVIRLNNVIMEHKLGDTKVYKFLKKRFIVSNHSAFRRYFMVRNMLYVYDMYKDVFPEYCQFLKKIQKGQIRYILMFEKDKINKLKRMYKGYKDYKKGVKGNSNE